MYDHRWNSFIKRITREAKHVNGNSINAVTKINISLIMQHSEPLIWEITGANRVEPVADITESLVNISGIIRQLSTRCSSSTKLVEVLQEAIDKL